MIVCKQAKALAVVFAILAAPAVVAVAEEPTEMREILADALRSYDGGDFEGARELWLEAANMGSTDAMTSLANVYLQGEGVYPNLRIAARWYTRAAELGDPIGQLNLGEMLRAGRGMPRDRVAAYKWLALAGRGGHAWAADQARTLFRTLSAEQQQRGRRLVMEWQVQSRK